MSQLRQWICLIHKLRKLRASKEFPDSRRYWPYIDQGTGCSRLGINNAHPFPYHSLQAQQPYTKLILDKLTYCTYPSLAQVVNIIGNVATIIDQDESAYYLNQVFSGKHPLGLRCIQTQPFVQ